MRKILLASAALGVVSAYVTASPARADDPVFPVTTETALAGVNGNQLAGAAPGSVQVNLGGKMYGSIWFQSSPKYAPDSPNAGNNGKNTIPQLGNFFFLYPSFDYTSPAGIHYGAQAEIRDNQPGYGTPSQDTFFVHQAWGYVSSDRFGKFQFGTPPGALTNLAVGTGDDFGTGDFFAYYGTTPYVPWVMGDSYDNYNYMQKLAYTTPTFFGFKAEVSWQPSAVSLTDSYSQTNGAVQSGNNGLLSRNRVEIAAQYSGNFGPVGVKVNGAYVNAGATPDPSGLSGQHVSFGNAGGEIHIAGFEVEASVVTGKYSYAITDGGNPMGPLPSGAKSTTAYIAGVGYSVGPIKVGGMYYGVSYDQADFAAANVSAANPSVGGHVSGWGLGATYTVGPGVSVSLDAITASIQEPTAVTGYNKVKNQASGVGLSTFFSW